jgi:hypothetical protein
MRADEEFAGYFQCVRGKAGVVGVRFGLGCND